MLGLRLSDINLRITLSNSFSRKDQSPTASQINLEWIKTVSQASHLAVQSANVNKFFDPLQVSLSKIFQVALLTVANFSQSCSL